MDNELISARAFISNKFIDSQLSQTTDYCFYERSCPFKNKKSMRITPNVKKMWHGRMRREGTERFTLINKSKLEIEVEGLGESFSHDVPCVLADFAACMRAWYFYLCSCCKYFYGRLDGSMTKES